MKGALSTLSFSTSHPTLHLREGRAQSACSHRWLPTGNCRVLLIPSSEKGAGSSAQPCSVVPFQGALPSATRRGGGRRGKDAPEIRSSRGRHGRAGGAHPSGVAAREAAGPAVSPAPHPYWGRSACRTRPLAARSGSKVTPWTLLTPPKYSFQLRWPRSAPFTNPLCMFLFLFKPRLPCDLFRKKKMCWGGGGGGREEQGRGSSHFFLIHSDLHS